jgi:TP901 family phage tail tape measure protein
MEPIELSFVSKGASIPGLDDVLSKLERVDALTAMLGKRSVVIDLKVNGGEALQATSQSFNSLLSMLTAAGEGGLAQKFGKAFNFNEGAQAISHRITTMRAELQTMETLHADALAKFNSHQNDRAKQLASGGFGNADNSAQWHKQNTERQQEIARHEKQMDSLRSRLGYMQQASGIGTVFSQLESAQGGKAWNFDAMKQGVGAAVEAEKKLETQAVETTGAMSAQMQVAAEKAKMMTALAAAVMKTAEADKVQAGAARENAAANQQAAAAGGGGHVSAASGGLGGSNLLGTRRRYVKDEQGNLVLEGAQQRFSTGMGREVTVDLAGNETRVTDSIRAHRAEMAQLLSEYRQRRAQISDPSQRALLDEQLAGSIRNLHAGMGPLGTSTEWGLGLPGKAGAKEESARKLHAQVATGVQRGQSEMDKLFWNAMDASNARDAKAQAQADAHAEQQAQRAAVEREHAEQRASFEGRKADGWRYGKPQTESEAGGGRTVTSKAQKRSITGEHQTVTLVEHFDAKGKLLGSTLKDLNNSLSHTGRGVTAVGESFARNLYSVTTWTAAVGALYAGLGALKAGFMGAIHTDREMAQLGSIFRGAPGEYKQLTSDILDVATHQGRMSGEAQAAGAKFAHLGLTRSETTQFTALSMRAANIAGIGGEEAAHDVASYTEAFGMDIGQATVALDQLNSIANHSNTTIKELMDTMGRTGAVAKATGFDFTTYASLLAGGAGKSGLPVTQFAQAMGMTLTNFADPQRAKELKMRFGVDTMREDGTAKSGPELIAALHARYQKMSPEAGQSMMTLGGGARNAQRMGAIFDNYDESISRSITAQRDLNSATEQNNRILDTTQAKLAGLESAWVAVWHAANQGGIKGVVNGVLGGAAGLLGAVDRGSRFMWDTGEDIVTAPFRKLGWAMGGMQGDSPAVFAKSDALLKNLEAREYVKLREEAMTASRLEWENSKNAMKVDYMVGEHFAGGAESIRQLPSAQGEKLIGLLAGDLGGDDELAVKKHKRDWLKLYDHGKGGDAVAKLFMEKAEESAAKARKGKVAELQAVMALRNEFDSSIEMMERYELVDPGVKRLFIADWKRQRDEIGKEHRTLPDPDQLPKSDSLATTNMRERTRYTLAGQEWMAGHFNTNSPQGQMDLARMGIAARGREADRLDPSRGAFIGPITDREEMARRDVAFGIRSPDRELSALLDVRQRFIPGAEAGLQFHREMGAFGVGLTRTRQIGDAVSGLGGLVDGIKNMPDEHQREGAAAAALAEAYKLQNDLLTRKQSILHDIRQTQQEMAREASRNLLLGSAGDQLAAAGLAGYFQKNGKMDTGTFAALDEATKRQILSTNPEMAPDQVTRLGELRREKGDLDANFPEMLKDINGKIESLRGGAPAVMNFNPTVSFAFGDQWNVAIEALRATVEGKMAEAVGQMRQENAAFRDQRQDVGADAMVGAQQ